MTQTRLLTMQKKKAFLPFPTMLSKGFFFKVVKSQDCVVKAYANFLSDPLGEAMCHIWLP